MRSRASPAEVRLVIKVAMRFDFRKSIRRTTMECASCRVPDWMRDPTGSITTTLGDAVLINLCIVARCISKP